MKPQSRAEETCHCNKSLRILLADFPGGRKICYVQSVIATVPAVPTDEAPRTTWREWRGCAPGVAETATRAFTPGRRPSAMSGTCIARSAATWICRAFRASTGLAFSDGCTGCFAPLRIAVPRAAIASSHFGFTIASYPRSNRWNQGQSLIPSRTSVVSRSGTELKPKVDFQRAKRMIAEGDGVRLITAVLLAGQMMTPDKIFVAESCPRQ
jgi:hypothetical protein